MHHRPFIYVLSSVLCLFMQLEPTWAEARRWEPMQSRDYWLTGTMGLAAVGAHGLIPNASREWLEPSSIDNAARSALRRPTAEGRRTAHAWSNVTLFSAMAVPLALDAGGITLLRDRDGESAAKITAINFQSFALTGLATSSVKAIVGRERPYARACRVGGGSEEECATMDEKETYKSFHSGHSAYAFTAAGLACLHHRELQLFGGRADDAVCLGTLALASSAAALRIASDNHYFSDVATGALVGFASGYFFPKLLHKSEPKPSGSEGNLSPSGEAGLIGLSHVFLF